MCLNVGHTQLGWCSPTVLLGGARCVLRLQRHVTKWWRCLGKFKRYTDTTTTSTTCPSIHHICSFLCCPYSLRRPPSTGSMQNGSIYKFVSLIFGNSCYKILSEKAEEEEEKQRKIDRNAVKCVWKS